MRHIDLDLLKEALSDKWKEKARESYEKVKNTSGSMTRSEALDKSSNVWKELKEQLKQLSHGKCWYCESSAHRIIGDVDHYRPKGQIKHYPPDRTVPDLSGYWWLAFCWRNFRYSCEMCNRLNTDTAT